MELELFNNTGSQFFSRTISNATINILNINQKTKSFDYPKLGPTPHSSDNFMEKLTCINYLNCKNKMYNFAHKTINALPHSTSHPIKNIEQKDAFDINDQDLEEAIRAAHEIRKIDTLREVFDKDYEKAQQELKSFSKVSREKLMHKLASTLVNNRIINYEQIRSLNNQSGFVNYIKKILLSGKILISDCGHIFNLNVGNISSIFNLENIFIDISTHQKKFKIFENNSTHLSKCLDLIKERNSARIKPLEAQVCNTETEEEDIFDVNTQDLREVEEIEKEIEQLNTFKNVFDENYEKTQEELTRFSVSSKKRLVDKITIYGDQQNEEFSFNQKEENHRQIALSDHHNMLEHDCQVALSRYNHRHKIQSDYANTSNEAFFRGDLHITPRAFDYEEKP